MTDRKLFPADIIQAAQAANRETGCPACVTLAQWAQESGFGKYLSAPYNFFGLKWYDGCPYGYNVRPTKEWNGEHYETINARFISFPSAEAAFSYHGKLLMNPNGPYKDAIPFKNDWRLFVAHMGPHYATDPRYGQHLVDLVNQYRLDELNLPS